jgi:FkbM family methyltransferase
MMNAVKWTFRRLLHSLGFDLRRWPQLIDFLRSRNIQTVLDVGANVGQFATELRRAGYRGQIISFEPVREVYARLEKTASADPLWSTRNYALGARLGTAEINVSDYSVFSSILPLTEAGRSFDVTSQVVRTETIEVRSLDDIFGEFADQRVFLKVDTQGFEGQVLDGARSALKSILGVQLELPIEHLYEGEWTVVDAISFMRDHEFVVAQIRPNGTFLTEDRVSVCELDVIFRRTNRATASAARASRNGLR